MPPLPTAPASTPTPTREISQKGGKTRWRFSQEAAEQFGIYAGTYGLAASWLARPHTQVVVVGEDNKAEALPRRLPPHTRSTCGVH